MDCLDAIGVTGTSVMAAYTRPAACYLSRVYGGSKRMGPGLR